MAGLGRAGGIDGALSRPVTDFAAGPSSARSSSSGSRRFSRKCPTAPSPTRWGWMKALSERAVRKIPHPTPGTPNKTGRPVRNIPHPARRTIDGDVQWAKLPTRRQERPGKRGGPWAKLPSRRGGRPARERWNQTAKLQFDRTCGHRRAQCSPTSPVGYITPRSTCARAFPLSEAVGRAFGSFPARSSKAGAIPTCRSLQNFWGVALRLHLRNRQRFPATFGKAGTTWAKSPYRGRGARVAHQRTVTTSIAYFVVPPVPHSSWRCCM